MTRVLVIGDSMSLAHVARAIVFARRLQESGEDVVFATGSHHQALAYQEGFKSEEVFCVPPAEAIAAIRRGSHIFTTTNLKAYVESDRKLIDRVQPDLVIGDFRLSLNISAQQIGVEYRNIVSGYMTRYYSAPQSPPETFPVVRLLGRRISRAVFPTLKKLTLKYYAQPFVRYRRQHAMPPIRDIFDVICSPHRNYIADLPEYTPTQNLPVTFCYVGPLLWEPTIEPPEWINELDRTKSTVYVTMGSTGQSKSFMTALRVLRDAGHQVLATTGGHVENVPDGVFAADYAPGSLLLRHCNAVVCHAGSLTTYQAVQEQVPVVGIPTFHDQETNVERIEALRWGVGLHPIKWRGRDLLAAVDFVKNSEIREQVAIGSDRIRSSITRFNTEFSI